MIGPKASEIMPVAQTAMLARLPYTAGLLSDVPESPVVANR